MSLRSFREAAKVVFSVEASQLQKDLNLSRAFSKGSEVDRVEARDVGGLLSFML